MFLFGCCSEMGSKQVYEVRSKNNNNQISSQYLNEISTANRQSFNQNDQIIKIKKSQYSDLFKKCENTSQKWTDIQFPPQKSSLGKIQEDIDFHEWKRIGEILPNPCLFDGKIEPQDVIQGQLGDCYFLSAVSSLSQSQHRIKNVFGNQIYNPNGIYKVTMRINGKIQEVIVDDFVPVNRKGVPIFCQPKKNQFWVVIMEKAWAKANGSYASIASGHPTEVFRAFTFAPAEIYITKEQEGQELWEMILEEAQKDRPCCCGTHNDEEVKWSQLNLVPGHAYTLIDATELIDEKGNKKRVLKLRNPWGKTEWKGQANENDSKWWSKIPSSQEKSTFLKGTIANNDGVFFITFKDYSKYFIQTHISYMEQMGNYISQDCFADEDGTYWELDIHEEGEYSVQLHQMGVRSSGLTEDCLARSTIVMGKKVGQKFQFQGGVLKYFQEAASLYSYLYPGKYVFYTKFDPSLKTGKLPQQSSISVYSKQLAKLSPSMKIPNFLTEIFLNHARKNKRQTLHNDQIWISWKLLFKNGGFAYLAFGNQAESTQAIDIELNESDFNSNNFELMEPYKGKGQNQKLIVKPGKEEIVIARVKNGNVKSLKFPPKINWKITQL